MDASPPAALTARERIDSLRLARSENVGPVTFLQLLRHCGSAGAALAALPELARRGGRRKPVRVCPESRATAELEALEQAGARAVIWGEPEYPAPLAAIEDPPPVLAVAGHLHLLKRHAVAIVGARNASGNGCRLARRLATALGAEETGAGRLVVTSGLARGIDREAHSGALESGTVAVVASGIDVVYPKETADLREAIIGQGVLLSEQPPGTEPRAQLFPRRNRIISGLSLGVVVIEAAMRSGSLITARMALEQGREVFAVPGSPLDPRSRGTNNLIRQGAVLTESADDVIRNLAPLLQAPLADHGDEVWQAEPVVPGDDELAAARRCILDRLGPAPLPIDELVRQCETSPAVVAAVLLELELAGGLERHPGHQVSLVAG